MLNRDRNFKMGMASRETNFLGAQRIFFPNFPKFAQKTCGKLTPYKFFVPVGIIISSTMLPETLLLNNPLHLHLNNPENLLLNNPTGTKQPA